MVLENVKEVSRLEQGSWWNADLFLLSLPSTLYFDYLSLSSAPIVNSTISFVPTTRAELRKSDHILYGIFELHY